MFQPLDELIHLRDIIVNPTFATGGCFEVATSEERLKVCTTPSFFESS